MGFTKETAVCEALFGEKARVFLLGWETATNRQPN